MSNRDYGTIVFWTDRSYGFVRPDAGERDIFLHGSELPEGEEVCLGDRVSYEVGTDKWSRTARSMSALQTGKASERRRETITSSARRAR